MNDKTRKIGIGIAAILGLVALLYVGGLLGQLLGNYQSWMAAGGMTSGVQIQGPNASPIVCFQSAFSLNGLKGMGIVIAAVAGLILYIRFSGQDANKGQDERGFVVSNTGTYGTAGWMSSKDMKEVFEITTADKAEGTILGEHKQYCRPMIRQIVDLAKHYDCTEHFYFASESVLVLEAALDVAPEIDRCALMPETLDVFPAEVLEWAIKYKCNRFQSLSAYITEDVINRAHEYGIRYNLFYADDPQTAKNWLAKGVDVILTDNYLAVCQGIGIH